MSVAHSGQLGGLIRAATSPLKGGYVALLGRLRRHALALARRLHGPNGRLRGLARVAGAHYARACSGSRRESQDLFKESSEAWGLRLRRRGAPPEAPKGRRPSGRRTFSSFASPRVRRTRTDTYAPLRRQRRGPERGCGQAGGAALSPSPPVPAPPLPALETGVTR